VNYVPPAAANFFLAGAFDWGVDTWRNAVIDGSIVWNQSWTNITSVAPSAIISDVALTNPTLVNGGALTDAADHGTLAAEITRTIVRHVIYHQTTDLIVAHYDTSMFGPIQRTIDGTTPVIVIPHPTGWFRFTNL
jgi:hypothetical protein